MTNFARLISVFFVVLSFSGTVVAENSDFHASSDSYQVYLGVVQGNRITKEPYLVDRDVNLHGGLDTLSANDYHVMVAIFDKKTNARIKDATVVAEVEKKGLMANEESVLPMEKMVTSGTVTYGNFFRMNSNSSYNIEVKIYRPRNSGKEEVEFSYQPF